MRQTAAVISAFILCSGGLVASQPAANRRDEKILSVREAVWRAWFADDETTLCSLLPPDALAISAGQANWKTRAAILADARAFHESGGKLIELTFGRTTVQRFGNCAFVYSEYKLETSEKGLRQIVQGRATEIFVLRDGRWINPGWHTDSQ